MANTWYKLLFTLTLSGALLTVAGYAAEKQAPGGEVTDAQSFVDALGGDSCAWIDGDGEICLRSDVYVEDSIIIKDGNFTLNGASCRLRTGNDQGALFVLQEGAQLNLGSDNNRDAEETLVLEGYTRSQPMFSVEGGQLNIYAGLLIQGNFAQNGGGIALSAGTVNMAGGVFEECSANYGGGVYVSGGTFNFTGGQIRRCTAQKSGGGIFQAGGTVNLEGGTVGSQLVKSAYDSEVTLTEEDGCRAEETGGGMAAWGGTLQFSAGSIAACSAADGGGLYVGLPEAFAGDPGYEELKALFVSGSIYACSAEKQGGSLFARDDVGILYGELLHGSAVDGGNLYIGENAAVVLQGGSIYNGNASGFGGGVYNAGTFQMLEGSVNYNDSGMPGAGITNTGTFFYSGGSIGYNDSAFAFGHCLLNLGRTEFSADCYVGGDNDLALVIDDGAGNAHPIIMDGEVSCTTTIARLVPVSATADGGFVPNYLEGASLLTTVEGNALSAAEYVGLYAVLDDETGGAWVLDQDGTLMPKPLGWQVWAILAGCVLLIGAGAVFVIRKKAPAKS